jgi:prophage regulatory protein
MAGGRVKIAASSFERMCAMNHYTAIIRLPKVLAISGCSRSYIYQLINEGLWPKSVRLGARAVGWPEREVSAVCEARIAGQSNEEIRRLIEQLHQNRIRSIAS